MQQWEVCYSLGTYAGAARGALTEGSFQGSTTTSYLRQTVTAFGPTQARDMVLAQNGGVAHCVIHNIVPA